MAVKTPSGKTFVTSAQGIASIQNISFQGYDSGKSIATFTFPAPPANASDTTPKMTVTVLDTSTPKASVQYFISTGNSTDATVCLAKSPPASCSSGTITVPLRDSSRAVAILIGGVEYSAYSAESQTTNAFLNIFYAGPVTHGFGGWGRIRLTSTPQQATNGVVSVLSSPTGLTTTSYSNVGQAFDYVFGGSKKLADNWSVIAGAGATTPLSSQSVPVTFVAPPPGTVECNQLVTRFSASQGYNPSLSLNTAPGATTCLAGGYTDVAFANQDRSSFYFKYGAGFRTSYPWKTGNCDGTASATDNSGNNNSQQKCSTAYAALDAVIGQDAAVTGGKLHGFVFKMDGILPIPTGTYSWLYLFGSSYIRLQHNMDYPPLLLQSPSAPVTVPNPSVIVLPLKQPNRDYYRMGVGINVNQLWCKVFSNGCTNSNPNAGASKAAVETAKKKKQAEESTD